MHRTIIRLFGIIVLTMGLTGVLAGGQGQPLGGTQILAKVDERGSFGTGSRITLAQFHILAKDGTEVDRKFAFFTKTNLPEQPDRLLAYFLEPELEKGTIFLSIDPVDPQEKPRLFLFLPALGQVRELISERDRKAGFAGSNIQQDRVGRSNFSKDYTAELVGEETVIERKTYVLNLTAKPGADVDYPIGKMWVDQEEFIVLRQEGVRDDGKLEQIFEASDLQIFEGRLEANKLVIKNVLDNSETEIITLEKRTVELPDEIFAPANLPSFDPRQYGVP
jgi:hypothetical protein